MSSCVGSGEKQPVCPCHEPCSLKLALEMIGGKWKIILLCTLGANGTSRYSELRAAAVGITNTMLSQSLRELMRDGLVVRTQYDEMPVRVEYSLTEAALSLRPIMVSLAVWAEELHK